jgi:hypothetical protein
MFVHSDGLQFAISIIGVIVFTGLTAWDAQRLKAMAVAHAGGTSKPGDHRRPWRLYLDFVNCSCFCAASWAAGGKASADHTRRYTPGCRRTVFQHVWPRLQLIRTELRGEWTAGIVTKVGSPLTIHGF